MCIFIFFFFVKVKGPLWKAAPAIFKNFFSKIDEWKDSMTKSTKMFENIGNQENNDNFSYVECQCEAHTSNGHEVAGFKFSSYRCYIFVVASVVLHTVSMDARWRVNVLDDSRVDAEHALRTRLEVEHEHKLNAILDAPLFSDGGDLSLYNLQNCFNEYVQSASLHSNTV
jgi:hypothetical protein